MRRNFGAVLLGLAIGACITRVASTETPVVAQTSSQGPQLSAPGADRPIPQNTTVFSDTFDGVALQRGWEVLNPRPDNFIVENGSLLTIANSTGAFASSEAQNVFRLGQSLPDQDYVISVTFDTTFATGVETLRIGLVEGTKNYISAGISGHYDRYGPDWLQLDIIKAIDEQATSFSTRLFEARGTGYESLESWAADMNKAARPIVLKLVKEGREFRAAVNVGQQKDEHGQLVWATTQPVSSLRPPKTLMLMASQVSSENGGETTFLINSVTIEVPQKE